MNDALAPAASFFSPFLSPAFTWWRSPVTWLEIVAFVLSIAMVLCNFRVNPWAWPLAIVSSALYGLLFASSRLYGEASLQLLFIVVAFWGWWQWLRGRGADGAPLRVHVLPRAPAGSSAHSRWQRGRCSAGRSTRYTDSDVPYLDALPTVGSVTGQILLGRKLVENWPVWLVVNLFSLGLFAFKELWLTVLLYAVFAVLSVVGWRVWLRHVGTT